MRFYALGKVQKQYPIPKVPDNVRKPTVETPAEKAIPFHLNMAPDSTVSPFADQSETFAHCPSMSCQNN